MTTAAALIIGDEILSGKFPDRNGPWLIAWLREHGIDLRSLRYLPDEPARIAEALRDEFAEADWVFTSGGVGPTHDDRTFEAVARALGRPISRHPEIVAVLERRVPPGHLEGALGMADIPEGAELWWEGEIEYPVVVVDKVVVLPGLPSLFQAKLQAVSHRFEGTPPTQRRLRTTRYESEFSIPLAALAERWPAVRIGSYPRTQPGLAWRVELIVESRDPRALDAALTEIEELLGGSLVQGEDPFGQA
jgi:molybdenum cofactor synthesis domain-containing protein